MTCSDFWRVPRSHPTLTFKIWCGSVRLWWWRYPVFVCFFEVPPLAYVWEATANRFVLWSAVLWNYELIVADDIRILARISKLPVFLNSIARPNLSNMAWNGVNWSKMVIFWPSQIKIACPKRRAYRSLAKPWMTSSA